MPLFQQPGDAGGGAFRRVLVMSAGMQAEFRGDSLSSEETEKVFRVLADGFHVWVPGFILLVSQGKIQPVRPALQGVGEGVFPEVREPKGAGHAGGPGENRRLVQGPEGKEAGQGIAGDPPPQGQDGEGFIR